MAVVPLAIEDVPKRLDEYVLEVLRITQANPEHMPEDFRRDPGVLVYLPLSYMIGGYTVLLPRSAVRPLNMSMEEAMRFTLTAGVTGSRPS